VYYDGKRVYWENRRVHTPNVVFGEIDYKPGGVCGPRVQRDFELVILHSGDCQVTLNREAHILKVQTVYLFLPRGREYFQFATDKETHHSFCSIRPDFLPMGTQKKLTQAPFSVPCSEVFRLLLSLVSKLSIPRTQPAEDLIDHLGLCAFAEFLNAAQNVHARDSRDPAVLGFLQYVEDHFGEEDCLQAAHKAANVSRNTLIIRLREAMHITPAHFLWKFRVERGVAMLGETGHTVAEIAYRCGFKSPFHFTCLVKRHFGQPPTAIRRCLWSKGPDA
jgi:AraC family transcriptional regulator of arabinose operon